jgi:hypothetical protein
MSGRGLNRDVGVWAFLRLVLAVSISLKGSFPHRGCPGFGSSQDDAVQIRLRQFPLLARVVARTFGFTGSP